jgi:hypothetical protein
MYTNLKGTMKTKPAARLIITDKEIMGKKQPMTIKAELDK